MKKVRLFLIAIASLTFILVAVAVVRNFLIPRASTQLGDLPPQGVDMQLGNIHYEQTNKDAFKEWDLNAQAAQYFKNENKVLFQSITLTFYSKAGKAYQLSADYGELYTDSKDVKIRGNVVVTTEEGYRVQTDSFQYNAKERKISTDAQVTLASKEMVMTGKGMVVDLADERLYILEGVRATEKQ